MSATAIAEPSAAAKSPIATAGRTRSAIPPVRFGPRLIHVECPAADVRPVQCGDRPLRLAFIGHLHKRKTPRTPSLPVGHQTYALHRPIIFEERTNRLFANTKIEIAYKNVFQVFSLAI